MLVEVRPENASFQRTQLEHYQDSVLSIKAAKLPPGLEDETIANVGKAFMANTEHVKKHGTLTMCSAHNISRLVTAEDLYG